MNGIPYTGWRCATCKSGNPLPRGRCRKCGRAKKGDEERDTFFRKPDKRRVKGGKKKATKHGRPTPRKERAAQSGAAPSHVPVSKPDHSS